MNMKRMRGRNHRPNSGGGGGSGGGGFSRNQQNGIPLNRNHVFDSSGPEMRVRGTAQQLYEKYQQMARDASSNGDRVTGEAYYQHAEHYFRIISAINQAQGQPAPVQGGQANPQGQPERGNYQPQPQGNQGNQVEYQRREQGELTEAPRQQDSRPQDSRPQEFRPQQQENRRFEPRPKPEFNRQDRQDRPERQDRNEQRFRQPEPIVDPRIDISSALEAELAATLSEPAGFGEQPTFVPTPAPAPVEVRSVIPIIPDAPPEPAAVAPEAPAVRVPRPRGRPRTIKPDAEKVAE